MAGQFKVLPRRKQLGHSQVTDKRSRLGEKVRMFSRGKAGCPVRPENDGTMTFSTGALLRCSPKIGEIQ
jgi:hypothetical protein